MSTFSPTLKQTRYPVGPRHFLTNFSAKESLGPGKQPFIQALGRDI